MPTSHVRNWQFFLVTDAIQRRRRLLDQDTVNIPQRVLDRIGIGERLPKCPMKVANRGEAPRIVDRFEQITKTSAMKPQVFRCGVRRAAASFTGKMNGSVEHDVLPFMRERYEWCLFHRRHWSVHGGRDLEFVQVLYPASWVGRRLRWQVHWPKGSMPKYFLEQA